MEDSFLASRTKAEAFQDDNKHVSFITFSGKVSFPTLFYLSVEMVDPVELHDHSFLKLPWAKKDKIGGERISFLNGLHVRESYPIILQQYLEKC